MSQCKGDIFALGLASSNLRHEIKQSNKGRLQERRGRLQNVLEQRRQAEVAEASTSTQTFGPQDDAEKKQFEALERKKEIKVQSAKKGGTRKMSRAQIREDAEKREAIARSKDPAAKEVLLEENVNRVEAETVNEAFSNLRISDTPEIEKHPESQDAHSKKKN